MSDFVRPISEVWVNALRAAAPYGFPMQDKPPFGYTDPVGEYMTTGAPTFDSDGNVISANDGIATPGVGNVAFNLAIKGIYPRSIQAPYDNLILNTYAYGPVDTPASNPVMGWYNFSTDATQYALSNVTYPPGYQGVRFESLSPADFSMYGVPDVPTQGFRWSCKLGAPQNLVTGGGCSASLAFLTGGSGNANHRWFAISLQSGIGIAIGYNDWTVNGLPNPETWVHPDNGKLGSTVDEIFSTSWQPPSTSSTNDSVDPQAFICDVLIMGGQIQLFFGGEHTPFCFPLTNADDAGTPDWLITTYQISGYELELCDFSVHQTKFYTTANFVSQQINLGFVPTDSQLADIKWVTHYTPAFPQDDYFTDSQTGFCPDGAGVSYGVYDLNGTILRYFISWNLAETGTYQGVSYGDYTSVLRAVTIDIPGNETWVTSSPALLDGVDSKPVGGYATVNSTPPPPESISITHTWDQSTLSINSTATLSFNNFNGLFSNSNYTGYIDDESAWRALTGIGMGTHHWVQILLGQEIDGVPLTGPRSDGNYLTEFTGVGGIACSNDWGGAGRDHVTIQARDRWAMLDVPSWNLPWMDGWNIYSAMAYLAALGTVGAESIGFYEYVPTDPDTGAILFYDSSPGSPPNGQYFLPSGPAGTELTRFGNGQNLRDIMLKLSNTIGFYLFFDVFGVLQFDKFQVLNTETAVKTFNEANVGTLDEMWSGSYNQSLEDTRNSVTVIGINCLGTSWFPVVAHQQDPNSIYDSTAANYIGWVKPMVWVDSLFTNSDFAQSAADALYAFLDLPDKQLQITVWYPADTGVYPTDLISMAYSRSGATETLFFVTQTNTTVHKGSPTMMTIQARIVPTVP